MTPSRELCAECGQEVLVATARRGRLLELEPAELIPAPCPRCRAQAEGCYLCNVVEDFSPTAEVVLLGVEGGARFGTLLDRRRGEAVHRPHSCSVRAAA